MAGSTGEGATRTYRSPLRDERATETRRAILGAAHDLFVAKGWTATGMRDVASAAGVAIETVYSHFSSKRGLLRAVADSAVVGDDTPIAIAERPEFAAMGRGPRAARIRAAAALITAVHTRTAAMGKLLRGAAPNDAGIAEMLHDTRERQRLDVERALELIIGRAPTAEERDAVWAALSPEVYLLLVDESAWAPEQYEAFVADLLDHLIPRPSQRRPR